ncbi:surface antigen-domain-containing protein [Dipodascopsis uninucleata]
MPEILMTSEEQKDAARVKNVLYEALERNQSLPVALTAVNVQGGANTRSSFLRSHLELLLSKPYTVTSLFSALDQTASNLNSFGIFSDLSYALDLTQPELSAGVYPPGTLPLTATMVLKEAPSKRLRTGTDVGNGEVSAYVNGSLNNIFGGAESLTLDANIGTRTKSSYILNYSMPIQNSHMWKADLSGIVSTTDREWASHEQDLKGLRLKATGPGALGGVQEVGYEAFMRSVTGLKDEASVTVRAAAGDSFKSSFFNSWTLDKRNDPLFPTEGYYIKMRNEVAGFLPNNKGDIQFMKGEIETQTARSFLNDYFTISVSARTGLLWSLLGDGKTNIVDRFFLGGPNDVRGFYLNRMGPSDEEDSIGGETYVLYGISLFSRLPNVSRESPLRLHFFANGGSLLGIDRADPKSTLIELLQKPSVSAGVGLIYRHPVARFELNFTLPIAVRSSEFPRKGFQFGIGLSYL